MNKIFSEVMRDIKPDRNYELRIKKLSSEIIARINKNIKNAKAVLGGSGAKGTWLKTFDCDIFVKFDYEKYKDKSNTLSDILEGLLKKRFKKILRLHGSRDYFQIRKEKFTFEIIPILDIEKAEKAKNITDVSPLHSSFVLRHKNLADEMRLTKQFCKACNVYGAESHVRGFSGYVCEILTIYYGSFLSLIKNAVKWTDRQLIDLKRFYKKEDPFLAINKSKLVSPLIVIDPVQKDRNASAALSKEKLEIFRKRAILFLKNPSKEFFEYKEMDESSIRKKFPGKELIIIKAEPINSKSDIAGAKLLKIYNFLKQEILKHDFRILYSDWQWSQKHALFYFVFYRKKISPTIKIVGPPIRLKSHVTRFKSKHKKTFIKNNRIYAIVKREFLNPKSLIKSLLKDKYLKGKIKKISQL